MKHYPGDIAKLSIDEVCQRIETLTERMMLFWKKAHGWAPASSAALLSKSMLEWQRSLAGCLKRWLNAKTDGELILAWANLGALVEGQLKLFLSVYYADYSVDAEAIKNKGAVQDPDLAVLEDLRVFFKKRIWIKDEKWDEWIRAHTPEAECDSRVQAEEHWNLRRLEDLRNHLAFVHEINARLPYPDTIYEPRES